MMRKTIIFAAFLLIGESVIAQTPQGYDMQQNLANAGQGDALGTNTIRAVKPRYEGVVGTPYFSEKPISGNVVVADGRKFTGFFNFDWMDNTPMYYKKEASSYMIIDNMVVTQLNLDYSYDSLISFDRLKKADGSFFFGERLGQIDSARIYLSIEKTLKKADFSGAYSAGKKYDEILNEYNYFICPNRTEGCTPFKPNKKGFTQLFPLRSEQIAKNSFLLKQTRPELIGLFLRNVNR
jgi:hypothetical protein